MALKKTIGLLAITAGAAMLMGPVALFVGFFVWALTLPNSNARYQHEYYNHSHHVSILNPFTWGWGNRYPSSYNYSLPPQLPQSYPPSNGWLHNPINNMFTPYMQQQQQSGVNYQSSSFRPAGNNQNQQNNVTYTGSRFVPNNKRSWLW